MKKIFSCNFTSELEELLIEKRVDVDYAKFPAIDADLRWIDRAIKFKPIMFHGFPPQDGALCKSDFIETLNLNEFNNLVEKTGTPHISGHIIAQYSHYPNYIDDYENNNYLLDTTIKNVEFIKSNVTKTLLLENLPPSKRAEIIPIISSIDFINTVVNETNSKFLFDVGHARIAADFYNMTIYQYIDKLPMDKLHEIHLSGVVELPDNSKNDLHRKMNKIDYEIFEYVLKKYSPEYITLEYGPKDSSYDHVNKVYKEELYEQICQIQEMLYKIG